MAQNPMSQMFRHLIEEAKRSDQLRDLLIDQGPEGEARRPHFIIEGQEYILGVVDNNPMLVNTRDKSFQNPNDVADHIRSITWNLDANVGTTRLNQQVAVSK